MPKEKQRFRRVLVLHQHFYHPSQGAAARSWYLAKWLAEAGYDMTVLAGGKFSALTWFDYLGIKIRYTGTVYSNVMSWPRRVWAFMHFSILACWHVLWHRYDIVYAISTPLSVVVPAWLARLRGMHYLFEVGDLWPQAPMEMGVIRSFWIKKVLYWIEKKAYQWAKAVVVVSPNMKPFIHQKSSQSLVHVQPNLAMAPPVTPSFEAKARIDVLRAKYRTLVIYAGTLGPSYGLETIVSLCAMTKADIGFVIAGKGMEYKKLKQADAEQPNMHFLGYIEHGDVGYLLTKADYHWIAIKDLPIFATNCPNKFFEAVAASCPVIVPHFNWLAAEVEKCHAGLIVHNNKLEQLVSQLEDIDQPRERFKDGCHKLSEKYSEDNMRQSFLNFMAGIV